MDSTATKYNDPDVESNECVDGKNIKSVAGKLSKAELEFCINGFSEKGCGNGDIILTQNFSPGGKLICRPRVLILQKADLTQRTMGPVPWLGTRLSSRPKLSR
jgi:hypothetical protein